jgi:hypothetical protein
VIQAPSSLGDISVNTIATALQTIDPGSPDVGLSSPRCSGTHLFRCCLKLGLSSRPGIASNTAATSTNIADYNTPDVRPSYLEPPTLIQVSCWRIICLSREVNISNDTVATAAKNTDYKSLEAGRQPFDSPVLGLPRCRCEIDVDSLLPSLSAVAIHLGRLSPHCISMRSGSG